MATVHVGANADPHRASFSLAPPEGWLVAALHRSLGPREKVMVSCQPWAHPGPVAPHHSSSISPSALIAYAGAESRGSVARATTVSANRFVVSAAPS